MEDSAINAILTQWQLEKLCRDFDLQPAELQPVFSGWRKHVILSKDKVFLFPRTPANVKHLRRELAFYRQFSHLDSIALPKLIRKVKDKEISYYEFGVVTRVAGVPFSHFIIDLSMPQMQQFLIELAETISLWHEIPVNRLPKVANKHFDVVSTENPSYNWRNDILSPATTEEAVDAVYKFLQEVIPPKYWPDNLNDAGSVKAKWTSAIKELAELPHVLVHGDVHEDHILVDPPNLKITGIIDWETARIDNPIWDFNFSEWGMGICTWWNRLLPLRRNMWRYYLEKRNLFQPTIEAINIFYLLYDFYWMVYERREGDKLIPTGLSYEKSMKIHLKNLGIITESL